jgi:hypothetical protein
MIIYLPLEKIDMRYTSHLDRDIREYLKNSNINHLIIEPKDEVTEIKNGSFLDAAFTVMTKSHQLYELAKLYRDDVIQDGDIIFTTDIWFTGIESVAYLNYFHRKKVKLKGVLHAGSFTDTDFVRDMERWAKNFEDMVFDIADEIFVASEFIKKDVLKKRMVSENKITVTGLPLDIVEMSKYKQTAAKKEIVVFNGRNVDEKQPHLFTKLQEHLPNTTFINTHKLKLSKSDYYDLLSQSKVVVSFALQENFGYGIQEAVYLGNIPILPNRLVYPEQFDDTYLYDTFDECVAKVYDALYNEIKPPNITVQDNSFIFDKWFKI